MHGAVLPEDPKLEVDWSSVPAESWWHLYAAPLVTIDNTTLPVGRHLLLPWQPHTAYWWRNYSSLGSGKLCFWQTQKAAVGWSRYPHRHKSSSMAHSKCHVSATQQRSMDTDRRHITKLDSFYMRWWLRRIAYSTSNGRTNCQTPPGWRTVASLALKPSYSATSFVGVVMSIACLIQEYRNSCYAANYQVQSDMLEASARDTTRNLSECSWDAPQHQFNFVRR